MVKQREKLDAKGKPVVMNEFASAHDLRRSFGFRWSRRVMPTILRELMRHESIDTTMRFMSARMPNKPPTSFGER